MYPDLDKVGTNVVNGSARILTLDLTSRIYIYPDLGNLGTDVANGSVRILTLDLASRIYIPRFG
jgi:hypothetical protein